jgi:hypothetical protein
MFFLFVLFLFFTNQNPAALTSGKASLALSVGQTHPDEGSIFKMCSPAVGPSSIMRPIRDCGCEV